METTVTATWTTDSGDVSVSETVPTVWLEGWELSDYAGDAMARPVGAIELVNVTSTQV